MIPKPKAIIIKYFARWLYYFEQLEVIKTIKTNKMLEYF